MFNKVLLIDIIPGAGRPARSNSQTRDFVDHFNSKLTNNPAFYYQKAYTQFLKLEAFKHLF